MTAVVIGIDPHKRSNTALVLDSQENVLARQRFPNDRDGYRQLKRFAQPWADRTWAVEGARGVGLGLAQRIAADGERVLNVPARLSARVRALGGSSGRKTDDADAYAVAVAGLRGRNLQIVEPDQVRAVLKLLSDRRQQLVDQRIVAVNRLHQLLADLSPGGADRRLTPGKARQLLASVRPRDQVGKARKQLALDHAADVERLDQELKAVKASIGKVVAEHPTQVGEIRGVGPVMTALILGEVGDVRRFPSKAHFASYTGTAPIDVSSGDQVRHRLNRGGNRRLNYALHIAALVQVRLPGPGRDYYLRKREAGKTPLEAMRCLKRRLSDVVFRALVADLEKAGEAGPAGHMGATLQSSASDPTPTASPSDKSLTGPATANATPAKAASAATDADAMTSTPATADRSAAQAEQRRVGAQPTRRSLRAVPAAPPAG
jgi:transposase